MPKVLTGYSDEGQPQYEDVTDPNGWVSIGDAGQQSLQNIPEELRQYARINPDGTVEIPQWAQDQFEREGAAGNPAYTPYYHAPREKGLASKIAQGVGSAGPFVLGGGIAGMAAGAGFGLAGAPAAGGAELSGSQLAQLSAGAGLGDTSLLTPMGVAPETAAGRFAGSVGSPLATGAASLPEWAIPAAGATAASAAVPALAGGSTPIPSGSPLSRIIDGTGTTADWTQVLGTAGATGLGIFAANQQANTLADIANQNRADRAPYLNASLGYLANPESYGAGPGAAAMKSTLAGLSAQYGNPIGSGTALQLATDAGLRDWRDAVTSFGNLGLGGQGIQAALGAQGAEVDASKYSTIAGGISRVVNPPRSLSDIFREYRTVFS